MEKGGVKVMDNMRMVKIKGIRKLEQKEDVYNMEVKQHHNFAVNNGLIVNNCL